MPYSIIIGDTEGRAKSLSRSFGSVLKQKGEEAPASGCVRNCVRVFVRHVVVRVSRVYVRLWMQEFHVRWYTRIRANRERHYQGGAQREIRICRAAPIERVRRCTRESNRNPKFSSHLPKALSRKP